MNDELKILDRDNKIKLERLETLCSELVERIEAVKERMLAEKKDV